MWYLPALIAGLFLAFAFLAICACIQGGRMESAARDAGRATPPSRRRPTKPTPHP